VIGASPSRPCELTVRLEVNDVPQMLNTAGVRSAQNTHGLGVVTFGRRMSARWTLEVGINYLDFQESEQRSERKCFSRAVAKPVSCARPAFNCKQMDEDQPAV